MLKCAKAEPDLKHQMKQISFCGSDWLFNRSETVPWTEERSRSITYYFCLKLIEGKQHTDIEVIAGDKSATRNQLAIASRVCLSPQTSEELCGLWFATQVKTMSTFGKQAALSHLVGLQCHPESLVKKEPLFEKSQIKAIVNKFGIL